MKFVNSKIHGILDYLTVVFLVGIGFGSLFSQYFSRLAIALGLIHLALTLLTDFKMGAIKLIPLKIHGYIELVVSLALVPAPFLLGYSDEAPAKIFTWAFAAVVFALFLVSDYQEKRNEA